MTAGKVKWFSQAKGFGFITAEDGTDTFVHHRDIQDESKSLSLGEAVTFELLQGPKGRKATNVRRG